MTPRAVAGWSMMLGMRVSVETYDSQWPRDVERHLGGKLAGVNNLPAKTLKRAGTVAPSGQSSRGEGLFP